MFALIGIIVCILIFLSNPMGFLMLAAIFFTISMIFVHPFVALAIGVIFYVLLNDK